MPRLHLSALALAFACVMAAACAGTSPGATLVRSSDPVEASPSTPRATRYKLDATRVEASTVQGTLEVRGSQARLVLDEAATPSASRPASVRPVTTRELVGTLAHDDVPRLAFPEGDLVCADDSHGMSCLPRDGRLFSHLADDTRPVLRFERLRLRPDHL